MVRMPTIPSIMNWDVNEDGLIGLEEAIHALQVISGVRSSE